MLEKRKAIRVEEAMERVLAESKTNTPSEEIPFWESDERILAEDLFATHPVPPFSKSPYDGFALKASDTQTASPTSPASFTVTERIGAGSRTTRTLEKGEAVRIMTGAEIPPGADCVVMFEICKTAAEGKKEKMFLTKKIESGENIIEQGSETVEGQLLVKAGERINPGIQALLATFGYEKVKVCKKPVIGIYATGSELLDVHEPLQPGKIRNSNAYMVASQVKRAGGSPVYLGKLADDFDYSFHAMKRALKEVDVLITTGGVSVGDFDLLPELYKQLEAEVLFNKVAMRPGSVTTVAKKGEKLLFGLSGNPSACYVGFELFARPYVNSLLGKRAPFLKTIDAELDADFPKANPFARFVRSKVSFQKGKVKVEAVGIDKSGTVTSLAATNALMVLPGGTAGYHQGDKVEALLLEDFEGSENWDIQSIIE